MSDMTTREKGLTAAMVIFLVGMIVAVALAAYYGTKGSGSGPTSGYQTYAGYDGGAAPPPYTPQLSAQICPQQVVPNISPEAAKAKCNSDPACGGFTMVPGPPGSTGSTAYFKNTNTYHATPTPNAVFYQRQGYQYNGRTS